MYKLSLANTTEQPILFKIKFGAPANGEPVNLDWPINGIKGSLGPNENATVALLPKIFPGEPAANNAQYELEKLKVELSWKADVEKIAKMADNKNSNLAAGNSGAAVPESGGSGAVGGSNTHGGGDWPVYNEWEEEMTPGGSSGEKNCPACTFLNPVSASRCSVCDTTFQ